MTTLLYGLLTGMSEGVERVFVNDFAREGERSTAYGWYHLMTGIAASPAGLLFGLVWQACGATAAFTLAGMLAGLAASLLWLHLSGPASRVAVRWRSLTCRFSCGTIPAFHPSESALNPLLRNALR